MNQKKYFANERCGWNDVKSSEESDDKAGSSNDEFFESVVEETASYRKDAHSIKRKQSNPQSQSVVTKKTKTVEKVKPPTQVEISELKETRNLFHSNLFRLQVQEMLTELKIKKKYENFISSWLEGFGMFLNKLESEAEKQDFSSFSLLKKCSVQIPLELENLRVQNQKSFQFQFIKPKEAPHLIGSASTSTLLGPKLVVDVAVVMPAECFQKENYLNLVYDQKRAIYLTYITTKLIEEGLDGITVDLLRFNYHANNPLKPVLEISLPSTAGSIAKKLMIRIFITAEESSFKLSRFVPWNNNIRSTLFNANDEDLIPYATPNYNAGVLFDLTMKRNQQLLNEVFRAHKNFQEGLILLKVWLQQRQLNVGLSGFHSHVLAMFIVYLFKNRKMHTNMSSYQVARNVWNQLACSKWNENLKGITMCTEGGAAAPNQPSLEQFHAHFDVVFIDLTGYYNICSNLSVEIYRRVCLESKIAVDTLNDMKLNSFQLIFMMKFPIYTQCDHILKINKQDVLEQMLNKHASPADRCNNFGNTQPQLLKIITTLLRKGIDQRVHSIIPIEQTIAPWSVSEKALALKPVLLLGFILNSDHAFEVLDKGPESFAEGAEEFRKFWGDKAQLRRFQDGTITEAVVWGAQSDPLIKKRLIVRLIVFYLLQLHLQIEQQDIEYFAEQFDTAFKLSPIFKTEKLYEKVHVEQDNDSEALTLNVIRSFDDLARKLHCLSELPLEIVSIGGIAPVFRYCEPEPVIPQARCMQDKFYANKVIWSVIQLGVSGKWPGELPALRALKTAFYIQIAKLLRTHHKYRTKVTLDGILVLKNGYVFGIEIAHPKEVALLKMEKNERGVSKYVDSGASIALEKRHYVLPKLTGALHGLYQMYPSFGATVMIAKRWLYSQLIDECLWPDECTELLIASQYLRTHAQLLPIQPQTGFLRFLQLLAFSDWKTEIFLINFNNEMHENAVSELENRFNSDRSSFPPLCIATAFDLGHCGLLWTSNDRPNVNILARVTLLARQALSIIKPTIFSTNDQLIKVSKIFAASNQGYDLVIQLKPDIVPNSLAVEFGTPFAVFGRPNFRLSLAGTNFLQDAVARLREAYSEFAAFFYNPCGGKEIAVVWKPNIFSVKDFKVTEVNGCSLSVDGKKVQCKKEIFIEDFKVILKDFYLRIDTVEAVLQMSRQSASQHIKNQQSTKVNAKITKAKRTLELDINKSLKTNKNQKYFKKKLTPNNTKNRNQKIK